MRDTKALQSATSHFLGQNFSKAYNVQFLNKDGVQEYAWGTSWGLSTRVVGGIVMTHGDDRGLRLPYHVAPVQVVIVPIYKNDEEASTVLERANAIKDELVGNDIRTRVDDRDQYRPGYKFSEWELKGVPIRIEIGPRDVAADQVVVADRVSGEKESAFDERRRRRAWPGLLEDGLAGALRRRRRRSGTPTRTRRARSRTCGKGSRPRAASGSAPGAGTPCARRRSPGPPRPRSGRSPSRRWTPAAPCIVCGRPGTERATWARAY